jgi:hypothetical protein
MLVNLLLASACSVTSAYAAVNFYGSQRPSGDYVTCSVANVTDDIVSAALSTHFTGEIVANSTDLEFFDEELVCGDFASVAVEFVCHDLGGNSTCIPSHNDTNSDTNSTATSKRSASLLQKRASGAQCNEFTLECRNQYQSTTGYCPSDYNKETFAVQGYLSDVWCTKPCTADEEKTCTDQECGKARADCDKTVSEHYCTSALVKCKGTAVKLRESLCIPQLLGSAFRVYCKSEKLAGVEYKDGACTLIAADWDGYVKDIEESLAQAFG